MNPNYQENEEKIAEYLDAAKQQKKPVKTQLTNSKKAFLVGDENHESSRAVLPLNAFKIFDSDSTNSSNCLHKTQLTNSNSCSFKQKLKQKTTLNSSIHNSKILKQNKLIFAHNFSLKFPLAEDCRIPFSKSFSKQINLRNSKQFLYYFKEGFVRQTSRHIIVFPYLEKDEALPKKSYELKARLASKAIGIVKALQQDFPYLRLLAPVSWSPSTQEYAVKDSYAQSVDFSFENDLGKIDKSVHVDESGYHVSGGEIDWKSPEFADAYIRMPLEFNKTTKVFVSAMKEYTANINLHLQTLQDIRDSLKLGKIKRPKPFHCSLKQSATMRGVN